MTFRFLHLADLHLETRFGGREAARRRLREATHEAFVRAVDFALERELHALLVAGDAFDDPDLSYGTELFFTRQIRRLTEAGVAVLYCCGNHDPGGGGKRAARLGLSGEHVHLFRGARPEVVKVRDRAGEVVGVVAGAGHPGEQERRNLAASFTPLEKGLPVVGLLHTQVERARRAEGHGCYAPSTERDLAVVDYDYWALGHVHLRQRPFPGVPAWYAGNLQGRNSRETGPKGGLLVELEPGEPADPAFVPFAPVRWERLEVGGLAGHGDLAALVDHLADRIRQLAAVGGEELAVRLELRGVTPLAAALRDPDSREDLELELMERSSALEVQIRPRGLRRPWDLERVRATPSVLSEALGLLAAARSDPQRLASLAPVPLAGFEGRDEPDPDVRQTYLVSLLERLEDELLGRFLDRPDGDGGRRGGGGTE